MSSSRRAGVRTLADALASSPEATEVVSLAAQDRNRPVRLVELALVQARLDAELARLQARRGAHADRTAARRTGTPQEQLFSEVSEVLTSASEKLPTAPSPRQPTT